MTEGMRGGAGRHFYPRHFTHLYVQSIKTTGPGTHLPIPIVCYLLLHPAQHAAPQLSSLLPLRRVPSPRAVIKTTGGIRNAAWLLPACNRHHLDHKRGGGVLPLPISPPSPSPTLEVKNIKGADLSSDPGALQSKRQYDPLSFGSFRDTKREMEM